MATATQDRGGAAVPERPVKPAEASVPEAPGEKRRETGRKAGGNRIPELDGLRVLMIFIVSAYHIWQQSWLTPRIGSYSLDYLMRSGYVWVDGTVLLSSFLLFLPYALAAREGRPLPDAREFYARRVRRIVPSFYFIILATFLGITLPWKLYHSPQYMVKDLATHLTFTFPFFYDTYIQTPLGAASWTLAIEVQAYLLFPLIARAAVKKPAAVLSGMTAAAFAVRLWMLWSLQDFAMIVNQLISFVDVYALGMALALLYVRLRERERAAEGAPLLHRLLPRIAATVFFLAACWGMVQMLRLQASSTPWNADQGFAGWLAGKLNNLTAASLSESASQTVIQRNQLAYRFPFALFFGAMILTAPFALRPLRLLLGNPVTRFLSGISMNYYLTHQVIINHMRRIGFPPSENAYPNQAGEQPWQTQYVIWSFALSFAAAVLVTYLVEKPAARWLERRRSAKTARKRKEAPALPGAVKPLN